MSKRIRFTADHDHQVRPTVLVAYKAGQELSVPDAHADAAVAAGKALPVGAPAAAAASSAKVS